MKHVNSADLTLKLGLRLFGLPNGMYVEYVGRLPNGVTFAIFRPEIDWDYDSFRCVFGADDGSVKEITVNQVVRYRDGGTTEVDTKVGNFRFPTPFNPELKPTFDGQQIEVEPR